MLKRCLTLRRLKDGWTYCHYINQKEAWVTLGKAALEHLDIDYAIRYAPSARPLSEISLSGADFNCNGFCLNTGNVYVA